MSVWGRRGSYAATAFVATFFVVVSTVGHVAAPFVEPEVNRDLDSSPADFIRMAREQKVLWRAWGPETVAESKRRDRPIFLVAAAPWSAAGQRIDELLSTVEAAEFLSQKYVCVRVDLLADPAWRAAPLAIARANRGDAPDFFVGVVTGDGRVVSSIGQRELSTMSQAVFIATMNRILRAAVDTDQNLDDAARQEVLSLRGAIESGGTETDDYAAKAENALAAYSRLVPYEADFLIDTGHSDRVAEWVDSLLGSTRCDVTWGGFFETWVEETGTTRFSKSSFSNAGMLRVLARLWVAGSQPRHLGAAKWQFDYVADRFCREDSSAGDYVQWEDAFRSPYYSFPRRRVEGFLTQEELKLAEKGLGIRYGMPIQGLPRMVDIDDWADGGQRLAGVLEKLRAQVEKPEGPRGEMVSFEAQADAVQSLLYSARIMGDEDRRDVALNAFRQLRSRMRAGIDDVVAGPPSQDGLTVGLPTYLAYAAAAWEAYLVGGEVDDAWDGVQVLDRAIFLYRDSGKSLWCGDQSAFDENWRPVIAPPVFDGVSRSPVGELIRLCTVYSAWPGCKSHRGSLIRARDSAVAQSSWVLSESPRNLGGLAVAILRMHRGQIIGFSGEVDFADWEGRHPGLPLVRLEGGAPGLRLFSNGIWTGPYRQDELEPHLR
ncbi:MAG: DUF255 domain-containing protein [Armatimonadetes bacterium]|nr:DUF255 domain-containing protein [Armatimonadota bacterium]